MKSKLTNKQQGFTIIEVMIVLAIAGLIMLIVFLAVPALQRNSRNTQRNNDVSAVLASVSEYSSNNNGQLPSTAADLLPYAPNFGYYNGGPGSGPAQTSLASGAAGALSANAANDRLVLRTGAKCGTGGATVAGSARQIAVQYLLETRNGFDPTCQQS